MKKYILFIVYVCIAILIRREFHPFSRFPMYNSFPNYGYVFLLKNERNETVFYRETFSDNKNAAYVAHNYYAFFNHHGYDYGVVKETEEHMREAGKELMQMIVENEKTDTLHFDTLRLYRRRYFLDNYQLNNTENLLHEQRIKP